MSPVYAINLAFISWYPGLKAPEPKLFIEIFPKEVWLMTAFAVTALSLIFSKLHVDDSQARYFLVVVKCLVFQGGRTFPTKSAWYI